MYQKETNALFKALGLKREVVGVRFLYYPAEYNEVNISEYPWKTSYCMMVRYGMDGNHFKAGRKNFGCRCAAEALGIEKEMECVASGERYYSIKLHESRSIAKAVTERVSRIKQNIEGIEIGPLRVMENADLVILMANPYQLMRIVQGYCYKFGSIKNLQMAGDQGVCADLTAAPFNNNDMNFSVLCAGTRKMARWNDNEMGIGIPIHQFAGIVDGVIQTLNYIEYPERKEQIRQRLTLDEELGIVIDDNLHYGKEGKEYVNPEKYRILKET